MTMHYSINMYKSKRLYQNKRKNLTYWFQEDDCFKYKQCDFKVKIEVGM